MRFCVFILIYGNYKMCLMVKALYCRYVSSLSLSLSRFRLIYAACATCTFTPPRISWVTFHFLCCLFLWYMLLLCCYGLLCACRGYGPRAYLCGVQYVLLGRWTTLCCVLYDHILWKRVRVRKIVNIRNSCFCLNFFSSHNSSPTSASIVGRIASVSSHVKPSFYSDENFVCFADADHRAARKILTLTIRTKS